MKIGGSNARSQLLLISELTGTSTFQMCRSLDCAYFLLSASFYVSALLEVKVQNMSKRVVAPSDHTNSLLNFSFEFPALYYETKIKKKMFRSIDLVWSSGVPRSSRLSTII